MTVAELMLILPEQMPPHPRPRLRRGDPSPPEGGEGWHRPSGPVESAILARSILRLLDRPTVPFPFLEVCFPACANCGGPVTGPKSPYCSDACKEEAAFVRQCRSALKNDTLIETDRQLALGQKLWFVLGGGRPYRRSLIPDRVVVKVIERHDGKCSECGQPATDVDHPGSG